MADLLNAPVIERSDKTNANNTGRQLWGKNYLKFNSKLEKGSIFQLFYFYFLQILYFVFLLILQKHITVVYSILQKYNPIKTQVYH